MLNISSGRAQSISAIEANAIHIQYLNTWAGEPIQIGRAINENLPKVVLMVCKLARNSAVSYH